MTGDDLDRRVAAAMTLAGSPERAARLLAEQPDVLAARVRPGLVKTEPPLVELVVDVRDGPESVLSRVYDVGVGPDGSTRLAGRHDG